MRFVDIADRSYRTDGIKSPISGRLDTVEYWNGYCWKPVRNVSRREEVLLILEESDR